MATFRDKHRRVLTSKEASSKIQARASSYFIDFLLFLLSLTTWIPLHSVRNLLWRISGVRMGRKSTLHTGVKVYDPRGITIGDGTIIGYRSLLDGRRSLTIGDHTDIASEVMIYNEEHDINDDKFTATGAAVDIGSHVFIGPRAIILPGVRIEDGAVVAAGAVVTKDVRSMEVVAGVPAKPISTRKLKKLNYVLGRFKLFQ